MSDIRLDRTVAIVTGAGSGMGAEMALALAAAGAHVAAIDVADERLSRTAARAGDEGSATHLMTVACDVSEAVACDAAVARVRETLGAPGVLVNNAGVGMGVIDPDYSVNPVRFWQAEPERWRRLMAINVMGPFLLARACVPAMLERGWGRVVNVTTSLDTMLARHMAPYGQSKAALEAGTASWAKDLEDTGVTANVLVPGGPTNTAFLPDNTRFARDRLIQPDVMRAPVAWLASTHSDGITGCRFVACEWDPALPPDEAAERIRAPVAWAGYGRQSVAPT
jgi:3-oxoacyl-[acyl-carrier protein] reductase